MINGLYALINGILSQLKNLKASWITSGRFGMARMPDMAANKIMVGQGAGSSPAEEDKPAGKSIITGTYVGDDAASRQITVGFKCSMVILHCESDDVFAVIIPSSLVAHGVNTPYHDGAIGAGVLHATDGFTVTTTAVTVWGTRTLNGDGRNYQYWAISE